MQLILETRLLVLCFHYTQHKYDNIENKAAKLGTGMSTCGVFSEAQRDRMSDTDTGCNTGNSNEVLGNNFSK